MLLLAKLVVPYFIVIAVPPCGYTDENQGEAHHYVLKPSACWHMYNNSQTLFLFQFGFMAFKVSVLSAVRIVASVQ